MSDYPNTKPKDEVRVEYTARVVQLDDHGRVMAVEVEGEQSVVVVPASATVEVLERAEPVCRATEGATGIDCQLPRHHPLDVDHEGTHEPNQDVDYPMFVRWPWQTYDPDYPAGPRAEIEHTNEFPPDADRLSMEVRQSVADLLVSGDKMAAIRAVRTAAPTLTGDEVKAVVEGMPEYGIYWNHHRATVDVALPEVDNEWIVQGQYYAEKARAREPRVFRSDGPEPPEDVKVLEWLDYDPDGYTHRFLRREGFGWAWVMAPGSAEHTSITFWSPVAAKTPFREVLPS